MQWVQLRPDGSQCQFIYNDMHFDQYARQAEETHKTKTAFIEVETLYRSTCSEIVEIVNRAFDLSLSIEQCSSESDFFRFLSKLSSDFRISDPSGIRICKPSRVGRDHSATHKETVSQLEVQKRITLTQIKDPSATYHATAEHYCIAVDGTVLKEETDGLY